MKIFFSMFLLVTAFAAPLALGDSEEEAPIAAVLATTNTTDKDDHNNLRGVSTERRLTNDWPTNKYFTLENYGWGMSNCLDMDMSSGNNLYMYNCHGLNNQLFYFEDGAVKSAHGRQYVDMCMDMNTDGNGNLYMHPCHYEWNQKIKLDAGNHQIWLEEQRERLCLAADASKNVRFGDSCNTNWNYQNWFVNEVRDTNGFPPRRPFYIKNRQTGSDKCLDMDFADDNLYMYDCHLGANQVFFQDDKNRMKSYAHDHKCMDKGGPTGDNLYMYPCHDLWNQKPKYDSATERIYMWEGGNMKCLTMNPGQTKLNAKFFPCHSSSATQKWYFEKADAVKQRIVVKSHVLSFGVVEYGCCSKYNFQRHGEVKANGHSQTSRSVAWACNGSEGRRACYNLGIARDWLWTQAGTNWLRTELYEDSNHVYNVHDNKVCQDGKC